MFATMQTGRMGLVSSDVGGPFSPSQTGPTLDLVFAGTGTDPLNAASSTDDSLDLTFVSQSYSLSVPYAVWGTSGLEEKTFSDIITFTRGSNATQFDSTGSLVYAPVNLLLRSESLATTAVWFNSGLTSITNNTPNTVDPAGGNTATELVVAASAGVVGQSAVLSGVNHTGSVWLRCASGTVTGSLIIYLTASPFTNIGIQAITITTTWQRFSVTTSSLPTAGVSYNFQIHNLSGGTVYAWGAQLNPSPVLGGITSSLTTYYPTTTAAYYGPRFDYNPSTLAAQGLLIEEARTNSIRNNTMQGAVAGTPGTLPTNWVSSSTSGVAVNVVGTGTESGITYIDVQFVGTPSATGQALVGFDGFSNMTATPAAVYTGSFYIRRSAGSNTNVSAVINQIVFRDSGGVNIGNQAVDITSTVGAANIRTNRPTNTFTAPALTAFVQHDVRIGFTSGLAIDITLRIGLPQLENNNSATGVASATVAAGGTGYAVGDVLQIVGGTGSTAARLTVATLSGSAVATVTVSTAGLYTTFPSPQPVSVTAITGTGSSATFNIVPQAQNGVATSVIPTTTTALTRNGDSATVNTLAPWYNAREGALYADVAIDYTVPSTKFPIAASLNDNTSNNRIELGYVTSMVAAFEIAVGGSVSARYPSVAALNRRIAGAYKTSDSAISVNGGAATATSPVSASLPTVTQLKIGDRTSGSQLNGWIRRITYYPRRLASADLQTITT